MLAGGVHGELEVPVGGLLPGVAGRYATVDALRSPAVEVHMAPAYQGDPPRVLGQGHNAVGQAINSWLPRNLSSRLQQRRDLLIERHPGKGDGAEGLEALGPLVVLVLVDDGSRTGVDQERAQRSEEHTSELQSRQYLVCRLLLEKKK